MIETRTILIGLTLVLGILGSVIIYFSNKILEAVSDSSSEDLKDKFSDTNNTLKSVLESLGGLKESAKQASTSSTDNYRDMIKRITNVERVFTTNQTRGALGEYVVEKIIGWIGLEGGEGKSWDKQKPFGDSRPDFTFYFPKGGYVHLDAKFPLDNYHEMIQCDPKSPQEDIAKKNFKENIRALLRKIESAKKDYIEHDGGINFVLIFIPNMQVLNFVREEFDDLYDYASKRKMLLVGPSELYGILNLLTTAIDNFKIEKSTNKIIDNMKKFQLEWDNMLSEFDKHSKQLKTAQGSFDEITGPRKTALEKIVDKIASSEVDKSEDTVKEE